VLGAGALLQQLPCQHLASVCGVVQKQQVSVPQVILNEEWEMSSQSLGEHL
jgi:hypothetical protein